MDKHKSYSKIQLGLQIAVVLLLMLNCNRRNAVKISYEQTGINYKYKRSHLTGVIERRLKVENIISGDKVSFKPDPDIEGHDEVRFYLLEDWMFNDVEYKKALLFLDGFALVVVDLSTMEVLYNSHTENPAIIDALTATNKICIGKILRGEYQRNNCTIETY